MKVTGTDSSRVDGLLQPEQAALGRQTPYSWCTPSSSSAAAEEPIKKPRKLANISGNVERLQAAKEIAEQAIKARHIFTIAGPYPHVRESMRRRGWIEKFYRLEDAPKKSTHSKKKHSSDDDEDDDDDDDGDGDDDDSPPEEPAVKPWEEENGIYGIMSRMARNDSPAFIWCIRRDNVDFRHLKKQQMVNHYSRNGAFTTKVGLCTNVRNARWFNDVDHNSFYPRCYRLSHEEEKGAFIDDYCLTACMSIVRWVIMRHREGYNDAVHSDEEEDDAAAASAAAAAAAAAAAEEGAATNKSPRRERRKKKKTVPRLPASLLDVALQQCHHWMSFYENEDLEDTSRGEMLQLSWDVFLQQYYDLCHNGGIIPGTKARLHECELVAGRLRGYWPQFDLDGVRNVWIVKPGAKSRGRGITCYDTLNDMLKLVDSVVRKESKYVVQKYIERPLLVHNTKFDIRQWFLVTDWNPLTIWWYKDCYLRFCKKQFSLTDFNEAIHLSNNSIQKHYDVDPERSKAIPDDSMWSSEEFKSYLRMTGHGESFTEMCLPAMKEAVICALQTTQDIIEYRKSSFELYGADFMLTDDLRPWLIEINSSPSMATTTRVTADLVPGVLEDTVKVLIDRKADRNCDTGRFELIYKPTPATVPQYLGISLAVEGVSLKCGGSGSAGGAFAAAATAPPGPCSVGGAYQPSASAGLAIGAASIAPKVHRKLAAPSAVGLTPFPRSDELTRGRPPNLAGEEFTEEKRAILRLTDGRDAAAARLAQPRGGSDDCTEPLLVKRREKWWRSAAAGAPDEASTAASHGSRVLAGNTPRFGRAAADDGSDVWPGERAEYASYAGIFAATPIDDSPATADMHGEAAAYAVNDHQLDRMLPRHLAGRRGSRETPAAAAASGRRLGGLRRDQPSASQVVVPLAPHKLILSPPEFFSAPVTRSYLPRHSMQRYRVDNGRRLRSEMAAARWQWQGASFPEGQTMYFLATNLSQHHA